jgi:hypothetical protein
MSHIEEGLLHAYLDGAIRPTDAEHPQIEAHLDRCGDCREQLEQARATRDRARAMLRDASPDTIPVPEFAAIVLRRQEMKMEAGTIQPASVPPVPAPRPGARRAMPLAWAASVLLALSAGWLAREAMVRGGSEMALASAESPAGSQLDTYAAAEAAEAADAGQPVGPMAAAATAVAAQVDGPARAAEAARTRVAVVESGPALATSAAAGRQDAAVEGRAEVMAPPLDPSIPVAQIAEARVEVLPGALPFTVSRDAARPPGAPAPVAMNSMRASDAGSAGAGAGELAALRAGRPSADSLRVPAPSTVPVTSMAEQRDGGINGVLRSVLGASSGAEAAPRNPSARGTSVSTADAARRLGMAPQHVPGLPVIGHWAWRDGGTWFVRTVQWMESGVEVEMEQWREPGLEWERQHAILTSASHGVGRHRLLVALPGGVRIAMSGPLPAAQLEAFFELLQPYAPAGAR